MPGKNTILSRICPQLQRGYKLGIYTSLTTPSGIPLDIQPPGCHAGSMELSDREIMMDWHHQCRTCRYWDGDRHARGNSWARCTETEITGMTMTTQCGYCPFWEPWDPATWDLLKKEDAAEFP